MGQDTHFISYLFNIFKIYVFSQQVDINKDVLLKLFNHTLEMRVWNIKEKLKPTAKNDRLNKPIKLPSNRSGKLTNDMSLKIRWN